MGANSGAGAAVASGAGYQARVASYILASEICGAVSNLLFDGAVATLGFETAECVDDINVRLQDGSIVFIQAKAKIDYSLSLGGELRSVFQQFEAQNSRQPNKSDSFVLVTGSRSSKKVIDDMRAALNAFRDSPEHDFFRDQPRALTEIINEIRRIIGDLQATAGRPRTPVIADRIIRKSFVVALDIEAGSSLEHSLILLLQSNNFAVPTAIWGKLIADCIEYAKTRQTLSFAVLEQNYKKYCLAESTSFPQESDELIRFKFDSMDFPVGKEVLLCRVPDEIPSLVPSLVIFELYRFDKDCAERINLTENSLVFSEDFQFPILRRAATYSGLQRLLDADPSLLEGIEHVGFFPMNVEENLEATLCAEVHRERLRAAALKNLHVTKCLHCGRPVSESEPCLIEQGILTEPIVGMCHTKCLLPADRLIGKVVMDFFKDSPELVNFDANAWFRASHGGQIAITHASQMDGALPHLLWSGDKLRGQEKPYVIEISLFGGGREIVTERNQVHRFSKTEAEKLVANLHDEFARARSCSDPLCYTDQSKAFSNKSVLLKQFGGKERIIPVEAARVRKYDEHFAARYHRPGHWYAPLMYLQCLSTGESMAILDDVPLISDPLQLRNFIDNWREAKIVIPDYEIISILSDSEFDEFMRWNERSGKRAVINPLINPANGELISGMPIRSLEAMVKDREGER